MPEDKSTPESRRMAEQLRTFYDQMSDESDRGAVIVSVAILDDVLTELVKVKLVPSLEKSDELFDSAFTPFSSFSAKIDLAYRIGLLRPSVRASLHLLRRVRNDFAHASGIRGFDHPSTQDRIRTLKKLNSRLLNAIIEVVNDANHPKFSKMENTNDLVNVMGWRSTLQMIFAALACGISNEAHGVEPLVAMTDAEHVASTDPKETSGPQS